jgi:hypothetical protein
MGHSSVSGLCVSVPKPSISISVCSNYSDSVSVVCWQCKSRNCQKGQAVTGRLENKCLLAVDCLCEW